MGQLWSMGLGFFGLILAGAPTLARAEDPAAVVGPEPGPGVVGPTAEPPPLVEQTPVAFTISGGVSLGAYEGGYLYYTLAAMRSVEDRFPLKVVTGASAGGINGFISILSQCGNPQPDPTRSLFWTTWMPIGGNLLYDPEEVTPRSVFTREAFRKTIETAEEVWRLGLDERCDVIFGLPVTRVTPRMISLEDGLLEVPRMDERFVVRIQGRGPGRPPKVTNWVDPNNPLEWPRLPLDGGGTDGFAALKQVILASSAFPLAFAPQPIFHCVGNSPECRPSDAVAAEFVDGGLFDNQPLSLAAWALRGGVDGGPDGQAVVRDVPDGRRPEGIDRGVMYAVDPYVEIWDKPVRESAVAVGAVPFASQLFGRFVASARSSEVEAVLVGYPEAGKRVFASRVHQPQMSNSLNAFFGFFEEEFRRFDFWLGMADARRVLEGASDRHFSTEASTRMGWPEEWSIAEGKAEAWRPYHCLRAVYDGIGKADEACAGEDLQDFRILLRISLEQLTDDCLTAQELGQEPRFAKIEQKLCTQARDGANPPEIPGVPPVMGWRRKEGEAQHIWLLRRLGDYGFEFKDLGLSRRNAREGSFVVRERLAQWARALARAQPGADFLPEAAVNTTLNAFRYQRPRNVFSFDAGRSLELGWSGTVPDSAVKYFRLTASVDFKGLGTVLSSSPWLGVTPMAGFLVEPPQPLSGALVQTRIGLRAGYLVSSANGFVPSKCDADRETSVPCSRVVTQAIVILSLGEFVRLSLAGEWMPRYGRHTQALWGVRPGVGLQLVY